MMPVVQWLNQNRYRDYPLTAGSERVIAGPAGTVPMPYDFLLDFQLTAYTLLDGLVALHEIEAAAHSVMVTFRYTPRGGGDAHDFTVTVPVAAAWPYRTTVNSAASTLTAVFGEGVETIAALAAGTYSPPARWLVEPALLVFQGQHRVTSLIGDTADSVEVSGDVYWEEGYSTRILLDALANMLIILPSYGAGAGVSCEEDSDYDLDCNDVLMLVNGAPGNAQGNFQFRGGNGIEITPVPDQNELRIRVLTSPDDIECHGAT